MQTQPYANPAQQFIPNYGGGGWGQANNYDQYYNHPVQQQHAQVRGEFQVNYLCSQNQKPVQFHESMAEMALMCSQERSPIYHDLGFFCGSF